MNEENLYSHVHEKFRHFVFADKQTRLTFLLEQRWVGYSIADDIFKKLLELMQAPKKPRMDNLLIIGDSNNGKTTIIRRFVNLHGESYLTETKDAVIPIILAESPPSANEKELYISLIERFAVPYKSTDSAVKLRYQAIHLFREFHVKILIIDEFHSLLTGTARQRNQVMNAIKLLCNELNIPIVGVGTKNAVQVLHVDPQHASRFKVAELPLWRLDESFQKLLVGIEKTLPLKYPSNLGRPEAASLVHSISNGNLGDTQSLISACAKSAIESGQEKITLETIREHSWLRPTQGLRHIIK